MNLKAISLGVVFASFMLSGCSSITILRTKEMKAIGDEIMVKNDSAYKALSAENDSLRVQLDSVKSQLDAAAVAQKRLQAEVALLSKRMSEESVRRDTRQEEITYRLDLLLGKSDKILAKKVVVSGAPAPVSMDSLEREAEKLVEAEAMFNTARSDYHRGEFKLAYNGFKQVYEQMKEGELAENSLYWMALCLIDVNQVDKAKKVFARMSEAFPDGQKTCPALFKLSFLYGEECDIDMQKQYLQKILSTKSCEKSAEFEQAAEMLQEILEKEDKKAAGEPVDACVPVVRESKMPSARVKPAEGSASEPTASTTAESTEASL